MGGGFPGVIKKMVTKQGATNSSAPKSPTSPSAPRPIARTRTEFGGVMGNKTANLARKTLLGQ
jgi:hypothetical protein